MMFFQRLISITATLCLMGACSGSPKSAGSDDPAQPAQQSQGMDMAEHEQHEGKGHHEHQFPPNIDAFHDVLAPLWHAEDNADRELNTCAAAPQLATMAQELEAAEAPQAAQADLPAWSAATAKLRAEIATLQQGCTDHSEGFTARFTAVHEAFHGVVRLIGHEE